MRHPVQPAALLGLRMPRYPSSRLRRMLRSDIALGMMKPFLAAGAACACSWALRVCSCHHGIESELCSALSASISAAPGASCQLARPGLVCARATALASPDHFLQPSFFLLSLSERAALQCLRLPFRAASAPPATLPPASRATLLSSGGVPRRHFARGVKGRGVGQGQALPIAWWCCLPAQCQTT